MRQSLADDLLAEWPALVTRLADRRTAFLDKAQAQCALHNLQDCPSASTRYLNLCCALGPAFEDRADNEWALAILADERLMPEVKLHQLVLRARHELKRRGGDEPALARTDAALLDRLDADRLAADADAPPLPRVACDIDAIDLRLLPVDWRQQYVKTNGAWHRQPGPALPAAVRIGADQPMPKVVCVLSHAQGAGPAAELQLRQIQHGGCAGDRHPAVRWLGLHGLQQWSGHQGRAVSWPVLAMRQPAPPAGLVAAIAEETSPDVSLLQLPSCGLRDVGVPLGAQALQVWTYPAHQYLLAIQRDAACACETQLPSAAASASAATAASPSASPAAPASASAAPTSATAAAQPGASAAQPSRCRLERDGQPLAVRGWLQGLDQALPAVLAQGMARLFDAWQAHASQPRLQARIGLFTGTQVLTWGWRETAAGLAAPPLMRLVGDLDLGCDIQLALQGDVAIAGALSAVRLSASGNARLALSPQHEQAAPPLAEVLAAAVLKFRFPLQLHAQPYANDLGIVCAEAGPCTGAISGELGLRPRLSGGSGWQWYARMALEPALAPVALHDPVLGSTRRSLALLPQLALLDWSLG